MTTIDPDTLVHDDRRRIVAREASVSAAVIERAARRCRTAP
jgi:hypothetical protein